MIDSIAKLEPAVGDAVVHSVPNLIVGLYTGIKAILPLRDSNNVGSAEPLPPVLPHSLVKHRTAQICELLRGYRSRLASAGWATEKIHRIETDHRELLRRTAMNRRLRRPWTRVLKPRPASPRRGTCV